MLRNRISPASSATSMSSSGYFLLPHQGFKPDQPDDAERGDRLVMEHEFIVSQRPAQISFERKTVDRRNMRRPLINFIMPLALPLGAVRGFCTNPQSSDFSLLPSSAVNGGTVTAVVSEV